MKNRIRFQKTKHNNILCVDTSNENFVEISISDSDNPLNSFDVHLDTKEVEKLFQFLEDWQKVCHHPELISNHERFSWFDGKNEE
jgi:L-ribulose-5-phosphate 3-epimerase UlaE